MARGKGLLFAGIIAVLLHLALGARRAVDDTDRLPGWKGERKRKVPRMITLHEDARIFMFENFLSEEECDHIVSLAEPRMKRSDVIADNKDHSIITDYRTSQGTFIERGQDKLIQDIEARIARWTLLPVGNGEGLQVLRYLPGQKYGEHPDYFSADDIPNISRGGNRYATVLMYLSDVEEGGETTFPRIPAPGGDNGPGFSECARYSLAAKPKKGTAILFHSIKPNGDFEKRSVHTACPVIKGIKWSAPKWIRVGHFQAADDARQQQAQAQGQGQEGARPAERASAGSGGGSGSGVPCADQNEYCPDWARAGECVNNPAYMIGDLAQPGACLKSCNRCDLVA